MLSCADSAWITCSCWNVLRSPHRARRCGAMPSRLVPSASTTPADGRRKPLSTLKNVVLPAPLGPTRPQTPDGNSNETPSNGVTPPKVTVSSPTRSTVRLRPPAPAADRGRHAKQLTCDSLWSRAHRVDKADAEHHEDEVAVDADIRQERRERLAQQSGYRRTQQTEGSADQHHSEQDDRVRGSEVA